MLIALVATAACGRAPAVDPAFQVYVDRFQAATGKAVFSDVHFEDGLKAVAQCSGLGGNVRVSPIYWQDATDLERERILFHELGHCVLMREAHVDTLNSQGKPVSLMHSANLLSDAYYSAHRSDYLKELVSPQ